MENSSVDLCINNVFNQRRDYAADLYSINNADK